MQGMASARAVEFRRSRLWMRRCLADGFGVDPAVVPLQSPPGEPPTLADGWGYVSLSHCCEAVFVAWSPDAVGVDLCVASVEHGLDHLVLIILDAATLVCPRHDQP